MGRKRFITSDMSSDDKIATVAETAGDMAALMWPWFISALDDWGRMKANPREVKLTVFQAMSLTPKDIQAAMEACHEAGLCWLYEVDGKQYLQANPESFYKLNTYIQESRRCHDGSAFPPPPDHPWGQYWKTSKWYNNDQQTSANFADGCTSLANFSEDQQEAATIVPSPSPSHTPSHSQGDISLHRKRTRTKPEYTDDFEVFWAFYPRPVAKKAAFAKWQARLKEGISPDDLTTAAKHYAIVCRGREEKYIMQPETFLGPNERWQEYLAPPKQTTTTPGKQPKAFTSLQAWASGGEEH